MLLHGWALKTCEEARNKRAHIIWLHLYDMSKIGKSTETESRLKVSKDWVIGGMRNDF